MMTSHPIRLLLVTPESRTAEERRAEDLIRQSLQRSHMDAELEVCHTSECFRDTVESTSAVLLLVSENGLPGRSAERIIDTFTHETGCPFLVLGEQPVDASRLHLLHRWGPSCVPLVEVDRLPLAIEHALREHEARASEEHHQNEMNRAADAMGQNQKLATIGRLAGSIAHEINNPLESITNLLYLIAHDPGLPSQSRSYLDMAQSELNRVIEISKQTLTFSRETAAPVPVRATDLLQEVLTLYRRRILEKKIDVDRQFDSSKPITVFPGEVRQVFSNLIGNALEAMEPHGRLCLRVRASTSRGESQAPGLRISIGDNGMGIDAEIRRRLGEPFFTTKGQRGTGLGLWVTRSIIDRYGGTLQLRSRTGDLHGTVFTVFLPAEARLRPVVSGDEARGAEQRHETSSRAAGGAQGHLASERNDEGLRFGKRVSGY